jgi:uncharacterized protein YodC (DUF2158 family)
MKAKKQKAITIGSVVQLKSGGPKMVVVSAVSNLTVMLTVLWADNDNRIAKADIALQAFRLVK